MAGFIELLSNLSSRRYMCDGMKNRKGHVKKSKQTKKNPLRNFWNPPDFRSGISWTRQLPSAIRPPCFPPVRLVCFQPPSSVPGWPAARFLPPSPQPLYLKPKHNPKENGGIYEVSQAKRWVTCREPVQRLRFATSTRRRRKTRQKEKQKKHFRPANLAWVSRFRKAAPSL